MKFIRSAAPVLMTIELMTRMQVVFKLWDTMETCVGCVVTGGGRLHHAHCQIDPGHKGCEEDIAIPRVVILCKRIYAHLLGNSNINDYEMFQDSVF